MKFGKYVGSVLVPVVGDSCRSDVILTRPTPWIDVKGRVCSSAPLREGRPVVSEAEFKRKLFSFFGDSCRVYRSAKTMTGFRTSRIDVTLFTL